MAQVIKRKIKRTTIRSDYRYDVRWRLDDGSVRTKTCRTRKEAEALQRLSRQTSFGASR